MIDYCSKPQAFLASTPTVLFFQITLESEFQTSFKQLRCSLSPRAMVTSHNGLMGIVGDPGADSGDEGKSKRVEKCGAKKSKERREEPLGTMSYQTSSRWSPLFWLLIGARKLVFFFSQRK